MIERCENSDSCPVSLSNCLKKCCFDGFNASLVIGQRSNCNLHVCICNRNRIWYVWCIELRITFFRGKEIKSSYSSAHLHKQIFQGTRSSHQIEVSHLSLRIVHLRGKVIKTMIWSGKLHIRRCFKCNIQITNLRDNFWLLYNSFCNIWWHL